MKKLNERCPLQSECEQKCTFEHHERDCSYYVGNSRPGYEIPGQTPKPPTYDAWDDEDEADTAEPSAGELVYISVDKLDPHPDNPRNKNLGDLTELADSIKANGVLQNLTVVPWFSSITYAPLDDPKAQADAGYRVVIGHRRLAAAKLAGLREVPCVVSDMSLRDQVRTMLMENIQRADLTVYEQAQGFQMMMNLGDSMDDIVEKTGFSESTVRRRVKLLELDQDKFKESEARGASLFEYAELEKIKDIDKRNEVLDKIGTDNFKYELKRALDKQEGDEQISVLIARLSEFATEVENRNNYSYVKTYYASQGTEKIETPEDADITNYYFCKGSYGNWIELLKERTAMTEDEAAKARREAEEAARKELVAQLDDISKRAYELRRAFVQSVSATAIKKRMADIITYSVWERMGSYGDLDGADFLDLLGVTAPDDEDEAEFELVATTISASPERALLAATYCDFDDSETNGYHNRWRGEHSENDSLTRLYDLLEKLGYKMSDEEKAMRNGTHELFGAEGGNDN